jgi:protein phosphatase PTC2/3
MGYVLSIVFGDFVCNVDFSNPTELIALLHFQVFDGHGGCDAASYMKNHAMRIFFEDAEFPQASQVDEMFAESVENLIFKAFLRADLALADDSIINRSAGTTALTALVLGR